VVDIDFCCIDGGKGMEAATPPLVGAIVVEADRFEEAAGEFTDTGGCVGV